MKKINLFICTLLYAGTPPERVLVDNFFLISVFEFSGFFFIKRNELTKQ